MIIFFALGIPTSFYALELKMAKKFGSGDKMWCDSVCGFIRNHRQHYNSRWQ
ncbi:hypothetical protein OS42_47370 [Dickeya oryzae]